MKQMFGLRLVLAGFAIALVGCQSQTDKAIDSYFEREKADKHVEDAINRIVKKRQEEARRRDDPPVEDLLKNRREVILGAAPSKGSDSAAITIVEFSDFQCPYCARGNATVEEVLKEFGDKVRLVFKHNPLSFHPQAKPAATAAMAAGRQGKFWEMHDKLFASQQKLADLAKDNFKGLAKELKLDLKKYEADFKDPEIEKIILADQKFAEENGAAGTPSFFIGPVKDGKVNGVLLVGAQPAGKFRDVINALLKESGQ